MADIMLIVDVSVA